jgi:hypothetical protein
VLHVATGANENSGRDTFGGRTNAYVSNFANHQYDTWRASGVVQNSNNFVEVGWFTSESASDQLAHPYKTWINDGTPHGNNYDGQNITPRDDYHNFAVKDPDNDDRWTFNVDGENLGGDKQVAISKGHAFALTESESRCTDDSRLAHFHELDIIKQNGGNWVEYNNLTEYIQNPPWKTCIDAGVDTSYDVKQNC